MRVLLVFFAVLLPSIVLAGGISYPPAYGSPTFTGTVTFPDSATWTSSGVSGMAALGIGEAVPSAGDLTMAGTLVLGKGSADYLAIAGASSGGPVLTPSTGPLNIAGSLTVSLNTGVTDMNVGTSDVSGGQIVIAGSASGASTWIPASAAGGTLTFPAVTDTVAVLGTAQTFTGVQTFAADTTFVKNGEVLIFLRNSGAGSDLKVSDIDTGGANNDNLRLGFINDAQNDETIGYIMSRGTTYNVAAHDWYTSTVAGTGVLGMELTPTAFSVVPIPYLSGAQPGSLASYYACYDPSSSPIGEITYQASNCTTSLRATKHDIRPYTRGLADALALKPSTFVMNTGSDGRRQVGLIAEDTATVDPDIAGYQDGKLRTVQYDRLGVVAIGAIQTLSALVAILFAWNVLLSAHVIILRKRLPK